MYSKQIETKKKKIDNTLSFFVTLLFSFLKTSHFEDCHPVPQHIQAVILCELKQFLEPLSVLLL